MPVQAMGATVAGRVAPPLRELRRAVPTSHRGGQTMTVLAAVVVVTTVFTLGLLATQPRREHPPEPDNGLTEHEARRLLYPYGNVHLLETLERGVNPEPPSVTAPANHAPAVSPLDLPASNERSEP
jgi:hypothetical protein